MVGTTNYITVTDTTISSVQPQLMEVLSIQSFLEL